MSTKHRITVRTDADSQSYNVVSVENAGELSAFLVCFAYGAGEWLAMGEYAATLNGETT